MESKMNHKQRRRQQRRLKRKEHRRLVAQQRDECSVQGESDTSVAEQDGEAEQEKRREEEHCLWLAREEWFQQELAARREREEREQQLEEEQQRKIKEEWEEQQKKEQEEQERREKENKEKKSRQDALLKEATANENKSDRHNPYAPTNYKERELEKCPFFMKTGACKFGETCSRHHVHPDSSRTLLFPGMFASYELGQSLADDYDMDLSLEYEEGELVTKFKEFYEDVLPEFRSIGKVVQFKVCKNCEAHLRGNVYVQFRDEEDALKAFMVFNGRWYAGKKLSPEFVDIASWKAAICGVFSRQKCPKGKMCNFLHPFKNPGNEFWEADRDMPVGDRGWSQRGQDWRSRGSAREDSWRHRHHRRSRSPHSSRRSSHRSRSRSPFSRHGSRSKRSRSRSRSPSRHRSVQSRSSSSRHGSHSRSSPLRKRKRSRSRSSSKSRKSHGRTASSPTKSSKAGGQEKRRSASPDVSVSNDRPDGQSSTKAHSHKRKRSVSPAISPSNGSLEAGENGQEILSEGCDQEQNEGKGLSSTGYSDRVGHEFARDTLAGSRSADEGVGDLSRPRSSQTENMEQLLLSVSSNGRSLDGEKSFENVEKSHSSDSSTEKDLDSTEVKKSHKKSKKRKKHKHKKKSGKKSQHRSKERDVAVGEG